MERRFEVHSSEYTGGEEMEDDTMFAIDHYAEDRCWLLRFILKGLLVLTLAALLTVLTVFGTRAKEPTNYFIQGEIGRSLLPLCDTQEQVAEIIKALYEGGMPASRMKFTEYVHTPSLYGGGACVSGVMTPRGELWVVVHEKVATYKGVPNGNGSTATYYIHRVTIPNEPKQTSFYLMATWDVITRERFDELLKQMSWQEA